MFGKKVTAEGLRDRLAEEYKNQPATFFSELGRLIADMHDYQKSSQKICKGSFIICSYKLWVILCDS